MSNLDAVWAALTGLQEEQLGVGAIGRCGPRELLTVYMKLGTNLLPPTIKLFIAVDK